MASSENGKTAANQRDHSQHYPLRSPSSDASKSGSYFCCTLYCFVLRSIRKKFYIWVVAGSSAKSFQSSVYIKSVRIIKHVQAYYCQIVLHHRSFRYILVPLYKLCKEDTHVDNIFGVLNILEPNNPSVDRQSQWQPIMQLDALPSRK